PPPFVPAPIIVSGRSHPIPSQTASSTESAPATQANPPPSPAPAASPTTNTAMGDGERAVSPDAGSARNGAVDAEAGLFLKNRLGGRPISFLGRAEFLRHR